MFRTSRSIFERINKANNLKLDYISNKPGLAVLDSIFIKREYADYFPFYEDAVIVDIGAHYGYFSLFAAVNSGSGSRIVAAEPDPQNSVLLQKNLKDCGITNVTTSNHAISHKSGKLNLYGGSSINRSLFSNYALGNGRPVGEVDVLAFKDFLEFHALGKIDFLKLDCEGAEYDIVLKTDPDLWKNIHVVSLEFHDMKSPDFTANRLIERFVLMGFGITKFLYEPSNFGLNYGKIIAVRNRNV